jgi:colanic acid biosynthesis glycosyl transferase WcaI
MILMSTALVDYANYPFLRGAATDLNRNGHPTWYVYSASFQSPNHSSSANAPASPNIVPIALDGHFSKQSLFKRRVQEIAWAKRCSAWLDTTCPKVVLAANCPLEVLRLLQRWCTRHGAAFIMWVQDIHGLAIKRILGRKLPVVGHLAGWWYDRLERRLIRESAHTILISPDHQDLALSAGQHPERTTVLENWAVLADHPQRPKDSPWSRRHGLDTTANVVYAGTLGMKHNPGLLLALARSLSASSPQSRVIVISEGVGADWLRQQIAVAPCPALVLLPFQPFAELPEALGAADVLTAILEPDASLFSVPSKTLSYLCAGRAQVAAVPLGNSAARMIMRMGAGMVVDPADVTGYTATVVGLLADAPRREAMATAARVYAESAFAPERIRAALLDIIAKAAAVRVAP